MNKEFIITESSTIKDALIAINDITHDGESLVVVNSEQEIIGTLTDGDIRRGLIAGAELTDSVCKIMHTDFKFINQTNFDVAHLKSFRDQRIMFIPILDEQKHVVDVVNLNKFKSKLPIDAVLMAGGKGVRLRPLTETTPKPLLPVGGKPIIDYNIDSLIENGIKNISVTVNYLHEQLEEHFANPINGVQVDCIKEPQFLGTMGATQFVTKFYNDVVLVMNSDLFTNIDYEDFYLHFMEHNADMSVAAVPYSISVPYGIFELEGRNIKGVKEKPVYNYFANAGIYLIKRELLENMPKNTFYNATDLMNDAVAEGKTVIRYPITGYWLDIGSHEEYKKANELVKHIKK
ncbi:nucleotidyltransferase family protein [Prevotella loescheii]|nr:nucleotidyltransferase family protein [Hoylesella loescheii]